MPNLEYDQVCGDGYMGKKGEMELFSALSRNLLVTPLTTDTDIAIAIARVSAPMEGELILIYSISGG